MTKFSDYYENADSDVCFCVNVIRDIAMAVVSDQYDLKSPDQNKLSVESSERFDACLEQMINEVIMLSIKQQSSLIANAGMGQGLSDRAAISKSTETLCRAIA